MGKESADRQKNCSTSGSWNVVEKTANFIFNLNSIFELGKLLIYGRFSNLV